MCPVRFNSRNRRRPSAPIDLGPAIVVACKRGDVARYAAADVVDELLTVGLVDRQRRATIGRGTGCDPDQINLVAKVDAYRSGECGGRIELERAVTKSRNSKFVRLRIKIYRVGGAIAQFEGRA